MKGDFSTKTHHAVPLCTNSQHKNLESRPPTSWRSSTGTNRGNFCLDTQWPRFIMVRFPDRPVHDGMLRNRDVLAYGYEAGETKLLWRGEYALYAHPSLVAPGCACTIAKTDSSRCPKFRPMNFLT